MIIPPPPPRLTNVNDKKSVRNSNLELYRIIVMLLIVAHHYVVNSGLIQHIQESPDIVNSGVMLLFGAWGKTGINCFVLITGYFMCKSRFTIEKLIKLYLQVAFYGVIIYGIFCFSGHEIVSPLKLIWTLWPVKSISSGFVSCFLLFYLFIPVLNTLVEHLGKDLHKYLVILIVVAFSMLPSIAKLHMTFNYVTWFMALYMISSYIRLYGIFPKISHAMWGVLALFTLAVGSLSILGLGIIYELGYTDTFAPYFFVADSNKFLSLAIAVSSFMYFKDLKIPYSRFINTVGAATFGVLLIHANSDAMRQWLWRETVDCVGHFGDSVPWTLGYAIVSVLTIFIICAGIDWLRGRYIEPKLTSYINGLIFKKWPQLQFK
ncbi:acyltransferase [Parabacteroides sp. ZJ-118]|uniref:acyltransferase family protein n=1 Tax=Parabacteroides sp. ZJ-118 TaxID=2709398 RepID=UPI0021024448|nr:acyltransferase [Parabacteroides sp. ZJ-118]